jgi:hypothetical protein
MLQAQPMLDEAEQRWEAVVALRPELESTVEIQRRLVGRGVSLAEAVGQNMPATAHIQPGELAIKLRAGTPMFIGTTMDVVGETLRPFVLGFCDDLAAGVADGPASRLRHRLEKGEIDIGSLVAASLGRQQDAIRTKAHHVGISPDLLWLVAELAAGPIAYRLQFELPQGDQETQTLVAGWSHGFCPACGSWPAFAERVDTHRSLRCSFCALAWEPPADRCTYCEEAGETFMIATPDADSTARLEMCQQCGGYLKSLAVESPTPFALLPVADLESSTLDLGAVGRGYGRPPMREFQTASSVPCPPIIET